MTQRGVSIITDSAEATRAVGRKLGEALRPSTCVALVGPLGAGKTQFVKGIAVGAGVADDLMVNSPTFVLVNEYKGRLHLYHLDAYRLSESAELENLGFTEMLGAAGAVIVEWADRVVGALPDDHLNVLFEHAGDTNRRLTAVAGGEESRQLLSAFRAL